MTEQPTSPESDVEDHAAEPERHGVVVGLLAKALDHRRLVLVATAIVLAAAVVAVLVSVDSGDEDRAVPAGTIPTLGNQLAETPPTTPSEPTDPEDLPAYSGAPLWTFPLPANVEDYDQPDLAVTDNGYVLAMNKQVRGLDKAGKQLWEYVPPEVDYITVRVTGPVVFVGYANPDDDRWPQPDIIIALDATTGNEIWREDEASLWSVTADTIYMSVCYGGQNNRIGDCQLSARDPRTNAVRWRVPTYASSRVVNDSGVLQAEPTPPHLLIGAYPTGAGDYTVSGHDPATGRKLGTGYGGGADAETARTVVAIDDEDDNPADGCRATLTGFAASGGAQTWQYAARTWKTNDGKRCARQPDSLNGGRLAVTTPDGAPSVLNVDTGAIEWSAPAEGAAIAASETTLLVASEQDGGGAAELIAYRVGNDKPLWQVPFTVAADDAKVAISATTAVVHYRSGEAFGYDLASGKAWTYGGTVQQATDTWIAVCGDGSCRGYATV